MPSEPFRETRSHCAGSADQALAEAAERQLRETSFVALHSLRCDCRSGVLVVHGRVPTFYARQVATAMLRKLQGVERVTDQIEVEDT